ncbi:MAG: insulinase family protein [Firmicutes bacterium]|nr:insulinase family protein [Bacillota bacterium]
MVDIPFVRSVSFGIWVKNGSRNEDDSTNGISHFIEHMLFKGTNKRSAKDIADSMDEIGGQVNAYTTKEHTCFYTRTLDNHFDIALDVLSDMFFNAKFDNSDIKRECNVILEEISMYEDTPDDLAHSLLQQAVFENGALGRTVLGTQETITTFDNAKFTAYKNANYTPNRTVVAIAGNLTNCNAVEKVKKVFSCLADSSNLSTKIGNSTEPQIYKPNFIKREKDIEQVHICLGFPGIAAGVAESYTMSILNTILGGGMSSRLFQTIREEHALAYEIYSYHSAFAETGIFTVYSALAPEQLGNVLELTFAEIRRLSIDKITQTQLNKAKEQLKSSYILSLESTSSHMNSIGWNQLMLNRILTADDIIEKIDQVNLDMFYQLYEKIFDIQQVSLSMVGSADFDYSLIS